MQSFLMKTLDSASSSIIINRKAEYLISQIDTSLNQPNPNLYRPYERSEIVEPQIENRSMSHMYEPSKPYEASHSPQKLKAFHSKQYNSEKRNLVGSTPSQFNSIDMKIPPKCSTKPINESISNIGSPKSVLFMEGKKFFKDARDKLSFEKFNAFLKGIKALNSGQSSKQDVIEQSKNIFGNENISLYNQFKQLVLRNEIK